MLEVTKPVAGPDDGQRRRLRGFVYCLLIVTAASISAAEIYKAQPLQSANDRSRWCTVWSLVERGTYRIDVIDRMRHWSTIDKVRHEGHFYSSKPPLLATLVAGIYWTVKQATGWDLWNHTRDVTRLILLIINLGPMIAAMIVMTRLVERYARTDWTRYFIVFSTGFATLLTPFLVTLNNHTVAAVSVIFALYPTLRILVDGESRARYFLLAGFFAAFVCCNELPAALFGVALFALLFLRNPWATACYFVPAALVPLGAYFVTNYLATGGWKPFYMYYGTEKYRYVHEGIPSYWNNPHGLDRSTDSPLVYFLHCTIGHHGIFSLSPIFLITLLSWSLAGTWRQTRMAAVHWLGVGLTVCVLGFFLTRTENYNYGGSTAGLRWLFWLIPFWLVGLIPAFDAWGERRGFRAFAAVCLAVSVYSAFSPLPNPWRHPWLFQVMQQHGWIDYRDRPPELPFGRPLWTWFPTLPDGDEPDQRAWIEFACARPNGTTDRLRLSDAGAVQHGGRRLRQIEIRRDSGTGTPQTHVYSIDVEAFERGDPPETFLRWPEEPPSPAQRQEAVNFLRALPRGRPYNNGVIRYVRTPLRNDHFRCQRAAAQILFRPPHHTDDLRYRIDVWLCEDVPFGTLQFERTVFDARTTETLLKERYVAVAASTESTD